MSNTAWSAPRTTPPSPMPRRRRRRHRLPARQRALRRSAVSRAHYKDARICPSIGKATAIQYGAKSKHIRRTVERWVTSRTQTTPCSTHELGAVGLLETVDKPIAVKTVSPATADEHNKSSASTSSDPTYDSQRHSVVRNTEDQGKRGRDNYDQGNGDDGRSSKRQRHSELSGDDQGNSWPCVFHVGEPLIYPDHTTRYPCISQLCKHLQSHQAHICPKCFNRFDAADALRAHACFKSCEASECRRHTPITAPDECAHECVVTRKDQWLELYRLIYPAPPMPPPYVIDMSADPLWTAAISPPSHTSLHTVDSGFYSRPPSPFFIPPPVDAGAFEMFASEDTSSTWEQYEPSHDSGYRSASMASRSARQALDFQFPEEELNLDDMFLPDDFDYHCMQSSQADSRDQAQSGSVMPLSSGSSRKRSLTGCLTCRKRRIKCDEQHPVCHNCIRSERRCEGYGHRAPYNETLHGANLLTLSSRHSNIEGFTGRRPVSSKPWNVDLWSTDALGPEPPKCESHDCPSTSGGFFTSTNALESSIRENAVSSTISQSHHRFASVSVPDSEGEDKISLHDRVTCFGCGVLFASANIRNHLEDSSCKNSYQTLIKNLEDRTAAMLCASPHSNSSTLDGSLSCPSSLSDMVWDEAKPTFEWEALPRTSRAQSEPAPSNLSDKITGCSTDASGCTPTQDRASQDSSGGVTQSSSGPSTNGNINRKRSAADTHSKKHQQRLPCKKAKKGGKDEETEEPVQCIWYVVNGCVDEKDARTWPSLSEMLRHMRAAHGIFLCEYCFKDCDNEQRHINHKQYGEDPCFKSCGDSACKRRAPPPRRDNACDHLWTQRARWLAAYQVAQAIRQHREVTQLNNATASQAPQIGQEASQDVTDTTAFPPHIAAHGTQRSTASPSTAQLELLDPNLGLNASSIGRVNDLLSRVTQLEQQHLQSQSGTTTREDEMASLRQSLVRYEQLLTTACHELLAAGSQSLAEGSSFRRTMSVDAPTVLADVDRIARGVRGALVTPLRSDNDSGASHGIPDALETPYRAAPVQGMQFGGNFPLQPYAMTNNQGQFGINFMGPSPMLPNDSRFLQAQSHILDPAMLTQNNGGMAYNFGPINAWASANAELALPMPSGPASDYHSQSSGQRK